MATEPKRAGPASPSPGEDVRPSRGRSCFTRRRRYWIDRRLQGAMLFAFFLQFLVFGACVVVALLAPALSALNQGSADTDRVVQSARWLLELHERLWPAMFGAFALVSLMAVRTSHRIAGPLLRMRRSLKALIERRDPEPIVLRKRDLLHEEASLVDELVRRVADDRGRLRQLEDDVRSLLRELEQAPRTPVSSRALTERLRAMATTTPEGEAW